LVEKVRY